MKISDVNVFCPDNRFRFGSVVFDEGGITSVDAEAKEDESADYLLPGFIDIHIHGTGGMDFLEGRNALLNASRLLPSNGVTTFLPTFAAAADDTICEAVSSLRGFEYSGAEPHSLHLEGPYISPAQKGAQNPVWMRKPNI
ncbi:MAG: amidohydrolase family protein, partial [Thermoplasmata archaeon]|nr:amidohydrolase family protein [Candidatus Sysuiplasma superficiale]